MEQFLQTSKAYFTNPDGTQKSNAPKDWPFGTTTPVSLAEQQRQLVKNTEEAKW